MENTNSSHSFAQPRSFKFVADHGEKFFFILILFGVILTYQDLKGQFLIDVVFVFSALLIILFICTRFLSKVIWRFDVDFDKKKITFFLCRSASPILINFTEIDEIKVSGPIVFFYDNRKLYYSTNQYTDVLTTLLRVKRITWGRMCNILGPDESIRKIVDKIQ